MGLFHLVSVTPSALWSQGDPADFAHWMVYGIFLFFKPGLGLVLVLKTCSLHGVKEGEEA